MIIKICGITNLKDAELAIEMGANTLGFVMYAKSPRNISPLKVDEILNRLPSNILTVGVFVKNFTERLNDGPWKAVQLHGFNDVNDLPVTKKHIFMALAPKQISNFNGYDLVIDESWGKGKKSDWQQLSSLNNSFVLSGGLTPENVEEALRITKPHGIDVSSGVEQYPGKKDPVKLRKFIDTVKEFQYRKSVT